jgi:hypothetical protein
MPTRNEFTEPAAMTSRNPATLHTERLDTYINLDRYPIHDLDSKAGRDLIADAQEMMERDTLCLLEGFLRDAAVSDLSAEIAQLEAGAHRVDYPATIYGWTRHDLRLDEQCRLPAGSPALTTAAPQLWRHLL